MYFIFLDQVTQLTLFLFFFSHQQQLFIRWRIPRVGSKKSGGSWSKHGVETLLAVEMGTCDVEGQGPLLNSGHPGSSSSCRSISPVLKGMKGSAMS